LECIGTNDRIGVFQAARSFELAAILPVAWAVLRHAKSAHALPIISESLKSEFQNRILHRAKILWAARLWRAVALERFSQLLGKIQHFCRWHQKQVAKIVHCGHHCHPVHVLVRLRAMLATLVSDKITALLATVGRN
jgi:hypothetical protein